MLEMQVRRHGDGSIDMDFYRARARTLRRATMARSGRAWRSRLLARLARVGGLLWPDLRAVDRVQLAIMRCGGRDDCK